jgi:hypothetical protein
MTIRNLDSLFKPASVALVGASIKAGSETWKRSLPEAKQFGVDVGVMVGDPFANIVDVRRISSCVPVYCSPSLSRW